MNVAPFKNEMFTEEAGPLTEQIALIMTKRIDILFPHDANPLRSFFYVRRSQ